MIPNILESMADEDKDVHVFNKSRGQQFHGRLKRLEKDLWCVVESDERTIEATFTTANVISLTIPRNKWPQITVEQTT